MGSSSHGIELASELWLDQRLTQCVPGCDHQREPHWPPLLDPRPRAMGVSGIFTGPGDRIPSGVRIACALERLTTGPASLV
jgi:hypothetical protein